MIRERRSKEKLLQYYRRFVEHGTLDANVHPWVAESWQRSRAWGVPRDSLRPPVKLAKAELEERRAKHRTALTFLEGLYQEVRGHFNMYNLSLLLLDSECYALKNYALPFFQQPPGEVEGARLTERDIGTSSIAIAYEHRTPFLVFGPEMWIEDGQAGDAGSAPVFLDGKLHYILTLVSTQQADLPPGALESLLLTVKYAMEHNLAMVARLEAKHAILDAVPLAVYHVLPGGRVAYANRLGQSRLAPPVDGGDADRLPVLEEVVLNYRHTPLAKGLLGIPSYNKEVVWITPGKTYEDITTVLPLYRDGEVSGIAAISQSIEDLKVLAAHAVGYAARYSLASLTGESSVFRTMIEKAGRAARSDNHLLLQGEPGTGKQRLAHGIHQAGSRAAGPLITIRCGDIPPEVLAGELFGAEGGAAGHSPGKLELAHGGTLFIDEIEKMPPTVADRLAAVLAAGRLPERPEQQLDVRIIAACDGDLRRAAEKGRFPLSLYETVAKPVIRVPALRARRDDVPLLAAHIIQELAEQHGMDAKEMAPQAVEVLKAYEWPGNIKQLQTVVEQAFFRTQGGVITAQAIHLPGETGRSEAWKEDREAFVAAWQAARGNVSRLAGMLDVSRVTLYRYIKKYGLEKE
ncbi:sigma-54-dependent Fis family transcriptional regulator [Anaeroselena agilis]|uniref:Sigma 54-interacting transcriptional regulator n=1 Tax=Anaeroselena agilis TaxID=3063788 RepID=A0ABU3P282_9FIRM|nr:sigma 54-interacting transcriptional regulator [Selenomonadales bacterium 4137-cl]